jgi:hypothetical protein
MSAAKHTPGPWVVDGRTIYAECDRESFTVAGMPATNHATREADARLIAAAPELLAACEATLAQWHSESITEQKSLHTQLRAAIAKAKGGTP